MWIELVVLTCVMIVCTVQVDGKVKRSGIGVCRGRVDGLVSLDVPLHPASGDMAQLVTKPLVVSGDELVLNVNTGAGGMIRVEVLNTTGDALPLFSDPPTTDDWSSRDAKSSLHVEPVVTNSIAASVHWRALTNVNGGAVWRKYGLESLRGQQVKLRFHMVGAKLYSYSIL